MKKHFMVWRVNADWLEALEALPYLPFEWQIGPKAKPPEPPEYACYAVVFDSEAGAETVRAAFGSGLLSIHTEINTKATAAQWHRVKHEPGSAYILAGQQAPRNW